MGFDEYDTSMSILDNLFNRKKKKDEEDVVDYHNEYLKNLGVE